jgi:hypothetical protein
MNGLLTTAEVAKRWGCTQQWVQALCKRGKLKAQLMGNSYVVLEKDAENYNHQLPGRPAKNGNAHVSRTAKRSQKKRAGRGARK